MEVHCFKTATTLLGATALRAVVGASDLDTLLYKRNLINKKLSDILSIKCFEWGVHIDAVELRDVVLPYGMQRVMASQAESERERRSKIISAMGEDQAAEMLLSASKIMSQNPATTQLRFFQSVTQVATERPTTIMFPIPLKLV